MADCKKCLHAPVCEKLPKMPGAIIAECAEFKDSTKWVERPKGRGSGVGVFHGVPTAEKCRPTIPMVAMQTQHNSAPNAVLI